MQLNDLFGSSRRHQQLDCGVHEARVSTVAQTTGNLKTTTSVLSTYCMTRRTSVADDIFERYRMKQAVVITVYLPTCNEISP